MSYVRTIPIRGSEVSRRAHEASVTSGAGAMQPGEYHSSTDEAGFTRHFIAHKHVGGYLYHGAVASEAAMITLDRPGYAHAVFPGDTCRRTDLDGTPVMLCIAGHGTLAADWVPLSSGSSGGGTTSAAWGDITGTLSDQTDLAAALGAKADASDLDDKWDTPSNATALGLLGESDGSPTWGGNAWPAPSGGLDPYAGTPPAADREFTYTFFGDTGGICYAIGSKFGAVWSAPGQVDFAEAGKIGCQWSGKLTGEPYQVVDRTDNAVITSNVAGSWIALDLGLQVRLKEYTVRNRAASSGYVLRNWKVQGCNTVPGAWTAASIAALTWDDIEERINDTTLPIDASAWGRFTIATPPETRYRFVRILQTGLNSSGGNQLNCGEIELYGTLSSTPTLPSGARGWLTDGLGRFVPWW